MTRKPQETKLSANFSTDACKCERPRSGLVRSLSTMGGCALAVTDNDILDSIPLVPRTSVNVPEAIDASDYAPNRRGTADSNVRASM